MVTIYSTTWCGFCKTAKKYFDQIDVKYIEINVEEDPKAAKDMMEKSGQMGVPVIDISGTIIVGFNKPQIDAALKDNKLVN